MNYFVKRFSHFKHSEMLPPFFNCVHGFRVMLTWYKRIALIGQLEFEVYNI